MTPQGHAKLREELKRLKEKEMPQISREIGTAREHGDLKENAEYHAAKERQGMIHSRIVHIEQALSRAEVIDPAKMKGSRVAFGARVKVLNTDSDEESSFFLVGPDEADASSGKISIISPLAKALVGKEVGDEVKLNLPAGPRNYEVVEVTFG